MPNNNLDSVPYDFYEFGSQTWTANMKKANRRNSIRAQTAARSVLCLHSIRKCLRKLGAYEVMNTCHATGHRLWTLYNDKMIHDNIVLHAAQTVVSTRRRESSVHCLISYLDQKQIIIDFPCKCIVPHRNAHQVVRMLVRAACSIWLNNAEINHKWP